MNVVFVAIEDTVEVFRRSQAMEMEVLSVCTMPKQLHPVSMHTEHQVRPSFCVETRPGRWHVRLHPHFFSFY